MMILDSSCWVSIFKGEPASERFVVALGKAEMVIVPSICIYEVAKLLIRELGEDRALEAIASMRQYDVINIDASISVDAAFLSIKHGLPLADSIIFAVSKKCNAELWTKDAHFKGLDGVKYIE